jgi:hypothetical protein
LMTLTGLDIMQLRYFFYAVTWYYYYSAG